MAALGHPWAVAGSWRRTPSGAGMAWGAARACEGLCRSWAGARPVVFCTEHSAYVFLGERVGPPAGDRRIGNLLPEFSALVVYEEVRRADLPARRVDDEGGSLASQQGEPHALPAADLAQAGNSWERGQGAEGRSADLRGGWQFGKQRVQRVEDVFSLLRLAGHRPAGLAAVP